MNLALSIRQRPIADYSFTRLSRPEESSGLSQPRNGDFNLNIAFECHGELDESKSVDPRWISRGISASRDETKSRRCVSHPKFQRPRNARRLV